jgi:mortality factor 4-like protein 1
VDDWEKVTKEQKLVPIPAKTSVSYFLNQYYEAESAVRRPGSADADILEEVIAGVKEYFNKSLGRILLYRFERPQFYNVHKDIESGHGEHAGKTLADMYGCEHLLRLFGELFIPQVSILVRSWFERRFSAIVSRSCHWWSLTSQ